MLKCTKTIFVWKHVIVLDERCILKFETKPQKIFRVDKIIAMTRMPYLESVKFLKKNDFWDSVLCELVF